MDDPIGALNREAPMPAMNFGPRVKPRKAARPHECETFEQLPNVGPAMAGDLRALGLQHPRELAHRDPFVLYQALCAHCGRRQDPCVLDTFMAAFETLAHNAEVQVARERAIQEMDRE